MARCRRRRSMFEGARLTSLVGAAGLVGLVAMAAVAGETTPRWPPFLPPAHHFSRDLSTAVERSWVNTTFSRQVRGRSVRAPFDLYLRLLETPDVTTAAARLLKVSKDVVRDVGDGWYESVDGYGARGRYVVLLEETRRRVIFWSGEHTGSALGTLRGDVITIFSVEPHGEEIGQHLAVHVRVENRFVAAVARVLIPFFSDTMDRRLGHVLRLTARVAEWAADHPEEFCPWLARQDVTPFRRARLMEAASGCHARRSGSPATASSP